MDTETTDERLARLECALGVQAKMIEKLTTAVKGHQKILAAWAQLAGIEPEPEQPARPRN
jgi:uncharacterized coiled-coil protein SlyX